MTLLWAMTEGILCGKQNLSQLMLKSTPEKKDLVIADIVQEEGIPIFGKLKYLSQCKSAWYVCTKVLKLFESATFSSF